MYRIDRPGGRFNHAGKLNNGETCLGSVQAFITPREILRKFSGNVVIYQGCDIDQIFTSFTFAALFNHDATK